MFQSRVSGCEPFGQIRPQFGHDHDCKPVDPFAPSSPIHKSPKQPQGSDGHRWNAPHTRLMSVQPIDRGSVRPDRALGRWMWYLQETVSQVEKSHGHGKEPSPACFKILLYQHRHLQDPRSAARTYRLSSGLGNLRKTLTTSNSTSTRSRGHDIDAMFQSRRIRAWSVRKRLNSGAEQPEQAETSRNTPHKHRYAIVTHL